MLHLDLPTPREIAALNARRGAGLVSIAMPTTPLTQDTASDQGRYAALADQALDALEPVLEPERLDALADRLAEVAEDTAFWAHQARSLVVLAEPDRVRTYRLANRLTPSVATGDRYRLTPLLRALTFPFAAHVLQLHQEGAQLWHLDRDGTPMRVDVPGMPDDAAAFAGRAHFSRSPRRRLAADEGKRVRLDAYARAVAKALRPVLGSVRGPLFVAASAPLGAFFSAHFSAPDVAVAPLDSVGPTSPPHALVPAVAAALDARHARDLEALRARFFDRHAAGLASADIDTLAHAGALGAVETLMVDMDRTVPGAVDPETGAVTRAEAESAFTGDILDDIAGLALATGARVLSVRAGDLPGDSPLAGLLRYRVPDMPCLSPRTEDETLTGVAV